MVVLIVVALFAGAAIGYFGGPTPLRTVTTTSVSTSIATVTTTSTPETLPSGARLYQVIFKQTGDCTPTAYAAPWSVTLGSWTVAEPSNATLPIDTRIGSASPSFADDSVIVFSVPNGEYNYSIAVGWSFGNPSGVIDVSGADVMVLLQGPFIACTTTTTA